MIKFSKPVLFVLFATSLFILGISISNVIIEGFKEGKELLTQIANLITYSCAGYVFYIKLYKSN